MFQTYCGFVSASKPGRSPSGMRGTSHVHAPESDPRQYVAAGQPREYDIPEQSKTCYGTSANAAVDLSGRSLAVNAGFGYQLRDALNPQPFEAAANLNGLPEPDRAQVIERSHQPLACVLERRINGA